METVSSYSENRAQKLHNRGNKFEIQGTFCWAGSVCAHQIQCFRIDPSNVVFIIICPNLSMKNCCFFNSLTGGNMKKIWIFTRSNIFALINKVWNFVGSFHFVEILIFI